MSTKKILSMLLCTMLLFSFIPASTIAAAPQDKFSVTFDIDDRWMTKKVLYITIQNLQDSPDTLDFSSIINRTDFGINGISNVEIYQWKNISHPYMRTIYSVSYVNHTEYNNITETWHNWTEIVRTPVGEELVENYYFDWDRRSLISKTEDSLKGELKHYWENITIQKYGQEKDTVKLKLIFHHPIVRRNDCSWGSKGVVWLDLNGQAYVDFTNSSWWDARWYYRISSEVSSSEHPYQYSLNVSSGSGTNNKTHVFLNGKNNTNFDDIRFVLNDATELGYWIEDNTTDPIKVWVNVTVNGTVYLYYGNPNAVSASDVTNTFIREVDGVVGSWHLDEGSGSVAQDTSGNGNDGTLNGTVWGTGKFDGALEFDGVDDYVNCGNDASLQTSCVTVEVWLNPKALPFSNWVDILSKSQKDSDGYAVLGANETNCIRFEISNSTTHANIDTPELAEGGWYHVVLTYDAPTTTTKGYLNGNFFNSVGFEMVKPTSKSLGIGGGFYTEFHFNGTIDEVRIYDRALSAEEISDLNDNYGYTTTNYPGKVLVCKYADPGPTWSTWGTEEVVPSSKISPPKPINPHPDDGKTGVDPRKTIISWAVDPSYPYIEDLKYNVKFYRKSFNMQMKEFVSEGQTETSWDSHILFYNSKYYWQVTAIDSNGSTNTSDLWTFTTRGLDDDAIEDKNYSKPFEDTFGTMNFSILQISDGVQAVYNNVIPAGLFYLFIFGMFFVGIYIRQGDVAIPALLGIILSPAIWTFVPTEYQGVAYWLLALSVGGILASLIKSKM